MYLPLLRSYGHKTKHNTQYFAMHFLKQRAKHPNKHQNTYLQVQDLRVIRSFNIGIDFAKLLCRAILNIKSEHEGDVGVGAVVRVSITVVVQIARMLRRTGSNRSTPTIHTIYNK